MALKKTACHCGRANYGDQARHDRIWKGASGHEDRDTVHERGLVLNTALEEYREKHKRTKITNTMILAILERAT